MGAISRKSCRSLPLQWSQMCHHLGKGKYGTSEILHVIWVSFWLENEVGRVKIMEVLPKDTALKKSFTCLAYLWKFRWEVLDA